MSAESDLHWLGVVVENFSFVFQLNNSQGSITRQEMRAFKKVWSVFDVDGTGYLNRGSIVPFLSVSHLPPCTG